MTVSSLRAPSDSARATRTRVPAARAWDSVTLCDAESAGLADAFGDLQPCSSDTPTVRRQKAKVGWGVLRSETVAKLATFARGRGRPELYVSNLPLDLSLPPTPVAGQTCAAMDSSASEFLMTVFSLPLGLPISYRDQRAGRLFHDIYPTAANARQTSSQSSSTRLGFHSEMFFHPEPPDFLALHCLRPDPEGVATTSIAALEDIIATLDTETVATLGQELFAVDLARLHGTYRHHGRPIGQGDPRPVVTPLGTNSSPGGPRLRFEPELTTPLTEHARRALDDADTAASAVATQGGLDYGGLLLLDNRRAVHSRSVFTARFDGHDRWLRRMMIGSATGLGLDAGYHDRPNLELVSVWEALGATMLTVQDAADRPQEPIG